MIRIFTNFSKIARNTNHGLLTVSERYYSDEVEEKGALSEVLYTIRNVDECVSLRCSYSSSEEVINFHMTDFGTKVKLFQGCDDYEQYYTVSGQNDIDLFRNCLVEDLNLENEIEDWIDRESAEDVLMGMIVERFSDPLVFLDSWLNRNNIPFSDEWHASYWCKIPDMSSLKVSTDD